MTHLMGLVGSLRHGVSDEVQVAAVRSLRNGSLRLAEYENTVEKVPVVTE